MARHSNNADVSKRVSYPVAIAELIARDPLFTELASMVRETAAATGKEELRANKIDGLKQNLFNKYGGAVHVHVPDPPNEAQISFVLSDFEKARAMSYTLSTVSFASGSFGPERAQRIPHVFFPAPERDQVPATYVRVDLSRITLWDLDTLATDFKEILRNTLALARGTGAQSDPRELAFLKTVRQDVFYRDLKRYDLHIKHGLTYRLIGFLETRGRTTPPDASLSSHRVGTMIPTESSVSDSVQRIYEAIHRVRYNAKSKQLEEGIDVERQYHCEDHGTNCPNSCPQVKQFEAWFNKKFRSVPLIARPARSKGKAKKPTVDTNLN